MVDATELNIAEPEMLQVWYSLNAVLAAAADIDSLHLDTLHFRLQSGNARKATHTDSVV